MKHFKLLFLCLFIVISTVYYSYSQDAGITTIGSITTCPGTGIVKQIVTVPIYIYNSPPISGLSLRIEYDGSVLSFVKVTYTNAGLDGDISGAQTTAGGTTKLMLTWTGSGFINTDGQLCYLAFNYYGGYSTLVFNNNSNGGQDCEYADPIGNPLNDYPTSDFYFNGFVGTNLYLGDISGNQNPLNGKEEIYTVPYLQGITNYEWTIPSGWTGTSTTNSITVNVGTGSGNITMTPTNSCGKGQTSLMYLTPVGFHATATPSAICWSNLTTNLDVTGSSGITGANWVWYTGSCGGSFLLQGTPIIQNITVTTTYWVRAESTTSTITSSCVSVTAILGTIPSIAPTFFTTSSGTICQGIDTLFFSGGSLGTAAHWVWYSGSCGGTCIGSDTVNYHVFNPTIQTGTYYVRAEGVCNTTNCINITITNNYSSIPSIINTSYSSYCPGVASTLVINSGILGNNARWAWYSGSCGGTFMGTGTNMVVAPTISTVYYARGEGLCDTTLCASFMLNMVNPSSLFQSRP